MSAAATLLNDPPGPDPSESFRAFVQRARGPIEAGLARVVGGLRAEARADASVGAVLRAVSALVMRGGKRTRAALVVLAYEASGGQGGVDAVVGAAVAVELLHAYFLVHDDWMDQDAVRRGGPAVHVAVAEVLGSPRLGDVGAVLGGDYACALAQEALLSVPLSSARVRDAALAFARMQRHTVRGQILDVATTPGDAAELDRMHLLKTGSYTVSGPLEIGARLAGASMVRRAALARYGEPLGRAFQLRDDRLGTFGDPAVTGKPAGSDLLRGAVTAVVLEAQRDPALAPLVERVLGRGDAPPRELAAVVAALRAGGVAARIEERIARLERSAIAALDDAGLHAAARACFVGAARAIASREA